MLSGALFGGLRAAGCHAGRCSADCGRRDVKRGVVRQSAGGGMLCSASFGGLRAAGCYEGVVRRSADGGMLCGALGRLRETTARGFLSQTLFFPCMERTWFREFLRSVWTRADVVS